MINIELVENINEEIYYSNNEDDDFVILYEDEIE